MVVLMKILPGLIVAKDYGMSRLSVLPGVMTRFLIK
jgi:hypothetical protein